MSTLDKNLITGFCSLGANHRNAASTYYVYMELSEVRRMFEVNYHYSDTLKRMVLTAKASKSAPVSTFLPIFTSENTSFRFLDEMVSLDPNKSIYLAMVSSNTTCVFYNLTAGLVNPGLDKSLNLNRRQKRDSELVIKRTDIEKTL